MKLSDAKKLAEQLLKEYDLDYQVIFTKAKRVFGVTKYRTRQIGLSKILVELNNELEVRDTILHEIAHAMSPGQKHNWRWQLTAQQIGCRAEIYYSKDNVITPPKKYKGTCPKCQRAIYRHKRLKISCGKCSKNYDENLLFKWELNN